MNHPEVISMGNMLVEVMRIHLDEPLNQAGTFSGPYPSGDTPIYIDTVARLGHAAGFIGAVGKDDFGRCLLERFEQDGVEFVEQEGQRGTADAVLACRGRLADDEECVVLCGDAPLIRPQTIQRLVRVRQATGADVAVLCGTDRIAASDQEIKALQAFVAGGGLLYMEAVGGAWSTRNAAAFAESGEALASQVAAGLPDSVAGTKRLRRLTLDSPMFTRKDFLINSVKFRKFSNQIVASSDQRPLLRGVLNGKNMPVILFSNEDITGGLVFFLHLIRMHCYQIHSLIPAFTAAPIPGMLTRRSMRSKISLDMIVSTM